MTSDGFQARVGPYLPRRASHLNHAVLPEAPWRWCVQEVQARRGESGFGYLFYPYVGRVAW